MSKSLRSFSMALALVAAIGLALWFSGQPMGPRRSTTPPFPWPPISVNWGIYIFTYQPSIPQSTKATTDVLSAQVNGITIEAFNFRIERTYFQADICFDVPTDEDWQILQTTLEFDGHEYLLNSLGLIDFRQSEDGTRQRCDTAGFDLGTLVAIPAQFRITIERLETSRAEQLDCTAAQPRLDAVGIRVECINEDHMSGWNILEKPDAMSDEEANRLIADAFIETRVGPWVFEVR